MKSKEKRKKEKAKKENVPINQNDEVKLQPGDLVITGSADANIKIWSLHSGECFHTLRGHVGSITALGTDPKGQTLFSGGADAFIRFWEIKTGRIIRAVEAHKQ